MDTLLLEGTNDRIKEKPKSKCIEISLANICPITDPARQRSALIQDTRNALSDLLGDTVYLRRATALELEPSMIESIQGMRYMTFHLFKGWLIPSPDWTPTDEHPETSHHLLSNANGQIIASARSSTSKIYPARNGHSPFEINHMTAFASLNTGKEAALSVVNEFEERYRIPEEGLTIGTIERLTISPLAFPSLTSRQLLGANMLLLSPLALDAFALLRNVDVTVFQSDDAMTDLFRNTYGPNIQKILTTTQQRYRALIDRADVAKHEVVEDACHTLVFNPLQLMHGVQSYNAPMYDAFCGIVDSL